MKNTYLRWTPVGILFLTLFFVGHAVLAGAPSGVLTVAFLDVGQGDSIFIEAPNGTQVLIDGGKGQAVLAGLGEVMPFGDHTIDVVLATHPDMDHIGGLPEVFARYDVGMLLEPGVADKGADYRALLSAAAAEGIVPTLARTGQVLKLDEGVFLEILFPDRDVSRVEPNMGSIVARLTYGSTSFLLTGDSPIAIEEYLTGLYGAALKTDVLKLGHHGSKTSTSQVFLDAVEPSYAVVSAGCDNKYGHPHAEVIERVETEGAQIVSTCEEGTIVFTSDGGNLKEH